MNLIFIISECRNVDRYIQTGFDSGHRRGVITMNLVECVNSVLKGTYNLPITALVRTTYFLLVELFAKKCSEAHA